MKQQYHKEVGRFRFVSPFVKSLVLAGLLTVATYVAGFGFNALILVEFGALSPILGWLPLAVLYLSVAFCAGAFVCFIFCVAYIAAMINPGRVVRRYVWIALADPRQGNPLNLKEGEFIPKVECTFSQDQEPVFILKLTPYSGSAEDLLHIKPDISRAVWKKFFKFAVTSAEVDLAGNFVTFKLENVLKDRSFTFKRVEEMTPEDATILKVQKGTSIDLKTSGSIIVAGKTRTGKTTGVISLLLQVLLAGRDKFGSEVIIVDPKNAELSKLPYVLKPDEDGGGRAILDAMRRYAASITARQEVLNNLCVERGDAVMWWDAGFHPSFLFLDEYMVLRTLYHKKAAKDNEGYTLDDFDALVHRIATMGASAGCYIIISVAQASVGTGGLSSAVHEAAGTQILFCPSMRAARFMWDAEQLEGLNTNRVYGKGDAWFTSTDGVHDEVSNVHFPRMKFLEHKELVRLLGEYYADEAND